MRVEEPFHYDAPPDDVVAMMCKRDFQLAKCKATGAIDQTVEIAAGASPVIDVVRTLPTDSLQGPAKALVGPTVRLRERTRYAAPDGTGTRTAELLLEFLGQPISMRGSLTLRPDGEDGTDGLLSGDIKAGVPLIGGKLEQAAAPAVVAGLRAEVRTGQRYLAERR